MSLGIVVVGVDTLAADMLSSTPVLAAKAATAAAVTARKIQQSARGRVGGHRHIPRYPTSITYDVYGGPFFVEAEIGPDKDRAQGPLGNLLEYGSIHNAPIEHLGVSLEEHAEDFAHGMEIAVHQATP